MTGAKMTDLVVKTNRLNSAVQNLSLVEIRIIQLAIIDARETGQGLSTDKPLRIHASRYAEAFGVNKKNAYDIIKEAEETLFNRRFSFIDEDGKLVKSRWLSQVGYRDKEGVIELTLTPAVVKGITRIDGAVEFFTSYLLSNTVHFKSAYSVRLYELLSQWKNNEKYNYKTPVFEINSFREQLGIEPNQYKAMKDFKKYVLERGISEINEHSDLQVSYSQHKKGRIITGFNFEVKLKKEKDNRPTWQKKGLTDKQIKKLSIYKKEFIDANIDSGLFGSCDGEYYSDTFERIIPLLKDPDTINQFKLIADLLNR